MITPDEAMRQAHQTAREYAIYGLKAFEDVTGIAAKNNPQATATFLAGFMQAASLDFAGWAVQNQIEKLAHYAQKLVEVVEALEKER